MKLFEQIKLIFSTIKLINNMKNLKDWKTTIPAIALLGNQLMNTLGIELPDSVTSWIIIICGAILALVKSENFSVTKSDPK